MEIIELLLKGPGHDAQNIRKIFERVSSDKPGLQPYQKSKAIRQQETRIARQVWCECR